ncbi:MAG: NfeD family protein [Clostridia bacterium]
MVAWQIWLIVAGFSFILEIATVGFLVFWFGVAALIVCILSLFIPSLVAQFAIFIILSALLICLTRRFAEKITKKDTIVTNSNSIIGKKAIVKKDISSTSNGQIKVNGDIWTAVLSEDFTDSISEGSTVEIEKIDGVKAVVKPLK